MTKLYDAQKKILDRGFWLGAGIIIIIVLPIALVVGREESKKSP